jgi:thiamine phosphate synthase YjbQ (UPF0047 family)
VFVSVTTVDSGKRTFEEATLVGEEMESWLREIGGFEGVMVLFREGTTLGITLWESQEAAERARTLRLQFLERITSMVEVKIQQIDEYEVAHASLGPNLGDVGA